MVGARLSRSLATLQFPLSEPHFPVILCRPWTGPPLLTSAVPPPSLVLPCAAALGSVTATCYNTTSKQAVGTLDLSNATAMAAFMNRPTSIENECCFAAGAEGGTTIELCISPRNWVNRWGGRAAGGAWHAAPRCAACWVQFFQHHAC